MEKFELMTREESEKLSKLILECLCTKEEAKVKSEQILKLFKEYQKVSRLDFKKTVIMDDGLIILTEALKKNKTISVLELSRNFITKVGAIAFAKGVLFERNYITKINFALNKLEDEGVQAICESLKDNKRLRELNLSLTSFTEKSDPAIALAIKEKPLLYKIDLSFNKIGTESPIFESFKSLPVLQELILNDNPLGDCLNLYTNLEEITSLKILNLNNCQITAESTEPFLKCLSNKKELVELYLKANQFDDSLLKGFAEMWKEKENCKIVVLDINHNLITDDGAIEIIKIFNEKDYIIEMDLRENEVKYEAQTLLNELKAQQPFLWIKYDPYTATEDELNTINIAKEKEAKTKSKESKTKDGKGKEMKGKDGKPSKDAKGKDAKGAKEEKKG